MTLVMYVVVTALVTTGLFLGIRYFVRAYLRYRDSRTTGRRLHPEVGAAARPGSHGRMTTLHRSS